jgi:DNA-binding MarR family transcriptional regulator
MVDPLGVRLQDSERDVCRRRHLAERAGQGDGLTRGAVSKLIDRPLHKKLVTRVEAAGDRRFQDIALTAEGRAVVPRLAMITDENDVDIYRLGNESRWSRS